MSRMLSLSACERVDAASPSNKQCYDPRVHTAIWHNSNPFVLEEYRTRLKNCRGCNSKFARTTTPKFVISHEERNKRGRVCKAFYHCKHSCIRPRNPYFKPCKIATTPKLATKLTMDDVRLLKLCGIVLSFVALDDIQ